MLSLNTILKFYTTNAIYKITIIQKGGLVGAVTTKTKTEYEKGGKTKICHVTVAVKVLDGEMMNSFWRVNFQFLLGGI